MLLPTLLGLAAVLVYVMLVIYPRIVRREQRQRELRKERMRNRLMAVATPLDDSPAASDQRRIDDEDSSSA